MSTPKSPGTLDYGPAFKRWRKAYAAAAKRDRYAWLLEQHGYDTDDDAISDGEQLIEELFRVVEMVVAEQCLPGMYYPDFEWFLAWQRYGAEPKAGYSVRFGPPDVEVFVDDLRVLDLNDLCDLSGHIVVTVLHAKGKITKAEARAIFRHVDADIDSGGGEDGFRGEHHGATVEILRKQFWPLAVPTVGL